MCGVIILPLLYAFMGSAGTNLAILIVNDLARTKNETATERKRDRRVT
jgi:hypothetical protein